MAVRKKTPAERAAAPVDTVGLKKRLARSEMLEDVNRTLERQNAGEAAEFRRRLGRSSIGESIARKDAEVFKRDADGHMFEARARRDSLETERDRDARRRGLRQRPTGRVEELTGKPIMKPVPPDDDQERANARVDRARRAALRPVRGTPTKKPTPAQGVDTARVNRDIDRDFAEENDNSVIIYDGDLIGSVPANDRGRDAILRSTARMDTLRRVEDGEIPAISGEQERFNAAADRAKLGALRPVRMAADNTRTKPKKKS